MNMISLPFVCFLSLFLQVFIQDVQGDIYLHSPRGSNNRLKSERVNRQNARRLFDSQNNAKGGYNVGEKHESQTTEWFNMQYYMGNKRNDAKTHLRIEWTNQHGCGDEDLNCNIVLQYKCQPDSYEDIHGRIRNGISENTIGYRRNRRFSSRESKEEERIAISDPERGMHEPWEAYDKCTKRLRNQGLYTADQNLNGDESKYTRQNPKGARHAYECPEERDYYPYWHPTEFIDIAVLANRTEDCAYYTSESFNTKPRAECMELHVSSREWDADSNRWRHDSEHNNKDACENARGIWVEFYNYLEEIDKTQETCTTGPNGEALIWEIPYGSAANIDKLVGGDPEQWKRCLVALNAPNCLEALHSRTNHLGNGQNVVPLSYDWEIPHFPSEEIQNCFLRIRYNISTNDYDPTNTFASSNQNDDQDSPIVNDPEVSVGKDANNKLPLQLAINTAQFGRTFQDRSHVFKIIPRVEHFNDKNIYNINVRGKRGNIVQAYPAVEYDFYPKRLSIGAEDLVHIQWTGSNRNPKGNAGEGRAKTDRTNVVDIAMPSKNYPLLGSHSTMFDNAALVHALSGNERTTTSDDIAMAYASAGYYSTASDVPDPFAVEGCDRTQAAQLDCYPPSYSGLLLKFNIGTYYYMCSRNNQFTNRNQKASLTVA